MIGYFLFFGGLLFIGLVGEYIGLFNVLWIVLGLILFVVFVVFVVCECVWVL